MQCNYFISLTQNFRKEKHGNRKTAEEKAAIEQGKANK